MIIHQSLDPDATIEWIPALRSFARSLTRNRVEADDLVQETLLKAIKHREKFRCCSNLRAWLFAIMRNAFYSNRRKTVRESTGDTDCISGTLTAPSTQEWSSHAREVMAEVNRLPVRYRKIFILVVMLGNSYEASAKTCGVAIGTVKSRVNRARRMIINDLSDNKLSHGPKELTSNAGDFRSYSPPANDRAPME